MAAPARRYLAWMFAAFAVLLAGVAVLSLYVDPYRIFYLPGRLDDAVARPRATQHVVLTKARGIAQVQPRTVVLGNSRAEVGFDPHAPAWPASWQPVYNAAVPGSGLAQSVDMLAQALRSGHVQHVVVGLEFLDFLTDADAPADAPAENPDPAALRPRRDALRTLLTLDSAVDSIVTLTTAGDGYAADVTARGFNPLRQYVLDARREGYAGLFLQRDVENARNYARQPHALFRRGAQSSEAWRDLERLLALADRGGVELNLVVYPYHAHTLELMRGAGLWPAFEAWKVHLADVVERHAGSRPTCMLWDFSGYHAYARERVPPAGDRTTELAWYWEAGHFKPALGERMLDRMFGKDAGADFGRCLTRVSAPQVLSAIRAERERYVAQQPDAVARLAALSAASAPRAGPVRRRPAADP
jgi:hypothetical protein